MADNKSLSSNTARNEKTIVRRAAMQVYSGPIPSANELRKYEEVVPGAADRILKMAEEQSRHRRKMESEMLQASIRAERIGQILGFMIFLTALLAGIVLMGLGKDAIGLITSLGSLAAIIGLFIYSRNTGKTELNKKKR